jgi:hypothetical protein
MASRLRASHPTLRDLTRRISAGPATGRDSIFTIDQTQIQDVDEELLRPAIRGRDVAAYRILYKNLHVLLPYVFDDIGAAKAINLQDYPATARFLHEHKSELSKRHCVRAWGKLWYEFHDHPSCDLSRQTKIVVPDIANSNRFALDQGRFFPLHSAYYILPVPGLQLDYVIAVLNSSVAAFLVRLSSPVV